MSDEARPIDDIDALAARIAERRTARAAATARAPLATAPPDPAAPEAPGRAPASAMPRLLVAIVGAPGSGKSTLAAALATRLADAVVVPMDGFHLDDALLGPAGLLPLKGSPPTFDVGGLHATLARIAADGERVLAPLFERASESSRAAAIAVEPHHRTVLVEGNYLLLDRAPWSVLAPLFDTSVMLEVPEATLRARLVRRWLGYGLDEAEAVRRAEANDLPNGALVRDRSRAADLVFAGELPAAASGNR